MATKAELEKEVKALRKRLEKVPGMLPISQLDESYEIYDGSDWEDYNPEDYRYDDGDFELMARKGREVRQVELQIRNDIRERGFIGEGTSKLVARYLTDTYNITKKKGK